MVKANVRASACASQSGTQTSTSIDVGQGHAVVDREADFRGRQLDVLKGEEQQPAAFRNVKVGRSWARAPRLPP
jgi:hypothetical protein